MRLAIAIILALTATSAWAMHGDDFIPEQAFVLETAAIGGAAPARAAGTQSSRIVVAGAGALVSDEDSGRLILVDANGAELAYVDIGADAGLLAYDGARAYVADRRGDRIIVVAVGARSLEAVTAWRTPAEPYGVALAPDRGTLYVTAIADRVLVAYDPATGRERWRTAIDAEPRGLAISADGARAAISSLTSGAIDTVALADHRVARRALPALTDQEHARGVFAIAFAGDLVVAPYQREIPQPVFEENVGHYGGAALPPVHHSLAFFDGERTARGQIAIVEPRAIAWDAGRDRLYVGGMGTDQLVQIKHASQVDPATGITTNIAAGCGIDGLATLRDGNVLAWCSFTRRVVRVDVTDGGKPRTTATVALGPVLAPSRLVTTAAAGRALFHTASSGISDRGMLTCGTCHLDGRADGLSWRIHGSDLQTPMLAGRLVGTAPFKWDGTAKTLADSVRATIKRLGGAGVEPADITALVTFLEATPAVRTPTREPAAVVRGQRLFESAELGCSGCHDGAMLTDQDRHRFGRANMDTPSLIGLAASAPYFHDGSAPTLDALLRDRGHVHGMASDATIKLDDAQLADLRAFLETR